MQTYLVIRFSSFGDAMLTLPVLKSASENFPEVRFVLVTKPLYAKYALHLCDSPVFEADTDRTYRGVWGMIKLARKLIGLYKPTGVLDLHSVIRSQVLSIYFRLCGLPVVHIKKERSKRRFALRRSQMILPHQTDLYAQVFERAGFPLKSIDQEPMALSPIVLSATHKRQGYRIGFAPLAKHPTKTWPITYSSELIRQLSHNPSTSIYLFGGPADKEPLSSLCINTNVRCKIGQMDTQEEIDQFRQLDLFISMDSGNMHLAAILGIPVISIWGATQPRLGYAPLFQHENNQICTSLDLTCRPCSIYGKKPCSLKESPLLCMTSIPVTKVLERIDEVIKISNKLS